MLKVSMFRYELGIKGMTCINCANAVNKLISSVDGISNINVNVIADKALFTSNNKESIENITKLFNHGKFSITSIKSYEINNSADDRILTLSYQPSFESEIRNILGTRNERITFEKGRNHAANYLKVHYNPNFTRGTELIQVLADQNIPSEVVVSELSQERVADFKQNFTFRDMLISFTLNIALTFLTLGFPLVYGHKYMMLPPEWGVMSYYTISVITLSSITFIFYGKTILILGFGNYIRYRTLNMFTLISLGILSACILSIFDIVQAIANDSDPHSTMNTIHSVTELNQTIGTCIAATIFGKYFEEKTKVLVNKEILAVEARMQDFLQPVKQFVPKNKKFEVLSSKMIHPFLIEKDDFIQLKPGNVIPFDGVIVQGELGLQENIKYGRAEIESKTIGDLITSGSEVVAGEAILQVSHPLESSIFFKLYLQIQESSAKLTPHGSKSTFLLGLIKYFIPTVIFISFFTLIAWLGLIYSNHLNLPPRYAFERAISVLVASCPCALGLAIPIVFAVGLDKALKKGILLKEGNNLLVPTNIDCVVLDKTGTITGNFSLKNYRIVGECKEELLWKIIKVVEKTQITHPIGAFLYKEAVKHLAKAQDSHQSPEAVVLKSRVSYRPAEGVIAQDVLVDGKQVSVYIGNDNLFRKTGVLLLKTDKFEHAIKTHLWLCIDNKPEMIIEIEKNNSLREEVPALLNYLKSIGKEVHLVTGDTKHNAIKITHELDINPALVRAECVPEEKKALIEELQRNGKRVMMVGDGINDLLAYQTADLSVSINCKSEMNIIEADVILLDNDITKLVNLFILSKWCQRLKNLSLFAAGCYNVILIPAAMGIGYEVPPNKACWAMTVSSLAVLCISYSLKMVSIDSKASEKIQKKEHSEPDSRTSLMNRSQKSNITVPLLAEMV